MARRRRQTPTGSASRMILCELHRLELVTKHFKHGDVARCPQGCVEQGPPGSFEDSVTQLEIRCAWEACNAVFTPNPYHPSQRFHTRRCRQAAYRLRRKSEGITGAIS